MNIKALLDIEMNIVWKKTYQVMFSSDLDKFRLEHYTFIPGEVSKTLSSGRKKSISIGVEMTRSDLIFKYYTFTYKELQKLLDDGIIGTIFGDNSTGLVDL